MNYLLLKFLFGVYLFSSPFFHEVSSTISKQQFEQIHLVKHSAEFFVWQFDLGSVLETTSTDKENFLKLHSRYINAISLDNFGVVYLFYLRISNNLLIKFTKTSIIYPFNSFL
jgi:hypothetical protein